MNSAYTLLKQWPACCLPESFSCSLAQASPVVSSAPELEQEVQPHSITLTQSSNDGLLLVIWLFLKSSACFRKELSKHMAAHHTVQIGVLFYSTQQMIFIDCFSMLYFMSESISEHHSVTERIPSAFGLAN